MPKARGRGRWGGAQPGTWPRPQRHVFKTKEVTPRILPEEAGAPRHEQTGVLGAVSASQSGGTGARRGPVPARSLHTPSGASSLGCWFLAVQKPFGLRSPSPFAFGFVTCAFGVMCPEYQVSFYSVTRVAVGGPPFSLLAGRCPGASPAFLTRRGPRAPPGEPVAVPGWSFSSWPAVGEPQPCEVGGVSPLIVRGTTHPFSAALRRR